MTKWCEYCEKTSHDSDECWSTHAIPYGPTPEPIYRFKTNLKIIAWQVRQALKSFQHLQQKESES